MLSSAGSPRESAYSIQWRSASENNETKIDNDALIYLMAKDIEVSSESDSESSFNDMSNVFHTIEKMNKLHALL